MMQQLRAGTVWMGQTIRFITNLFGKDYYWLEDIDGTLYLTRVGPNGFPDLS